MAGKKTATADCDMTFKGSVDSKTSYKCKGTKVVGPQQKCTQKVSAMTPDLATVQLKIMSTTLQTVMAIPLVGGGVPGPVPFTAIGSPLGQLLDQMVSAIADLRTDLAAVVKALQNHGLIDGAPPSV